MATTRLNYESDLLGIGRVNEWKNRKEKWHIYACVLSTELWNMMLN